MPALVRRGSLWQRLKTRLDPKELALSLAEELNDDKYLDLVNRAAIPLAISLNAIFILIRNTDKEDDDVFGDARQGRVYIFLHTFVLYGLAMLSCLNASYTYLRKKHYQLLEQPIDQPPPTANAKRVLLDTGNGKEEVWQVDVWHPSELGLVISTFFSPIHVLLYYTALPSTSIHALVVGALGLAISVQAFILQDSFLRQAQDTRVIHGQVLNEYNTKFVQPLMHRAVRDIGVQASPQGRWAVDAYSPGVQLNRGTGHLNYTPRSLSKDHGTTTARFQPNGYTPSQARLPASNRSSLSALKQQHYPQQIGEHLTPPIRFNSNNTQSSPLADGDEIRVIHKNSPSVPKDKRKSFRPSR